MQINGVPVGQWHLDDLRPHDLGYLGVQAVRLLRNEHLVALLKQRLRDAVEHVAGAVAQANPGRIGDAELVGQQLLELDVVALRVDIDQRHLVTHRLQRMRVRTVHVLVRSELDDAAQPIVTHYIVHTLAGHILLTCERRLANSVDHQSPFLGIES